MEYALLVAGSILLVSGLYFVSFRYSTASSTIVLILGSAILVMGVLQVSNAKIAGLGFEMTLQLVEKNLKEVTEINMDVKDKDLPRLRVDVQKATEALERQDGVNQKLADAINELQQSLKLKVPDINDQGALFDRNNKYTVLVFYRDSRKEDAANLQAALTAAGYAASSIMTDLSEVQIAVPPPQSTVIIPTQKGMKVGQDVLALTENILPAPRNSLASLGEAHSLRRGDLQILLF